MLAVYNADQDEMIPVQTVAHYETCADVMINVLMNAILQTEYCPASIEVRDPYTEALLRQWCRELQIPLIVRKDIPGLDERIFEYVEAFYIRYGDLSIQMEIMEEWIESLLDYSLEEVLAMPEEERTMIDEIFSDEELIRELPEKIRKKIRKLKRKMEAPRKKINDEEKVLLQFASSLERMARKEKKLMMKRTGENTLDSHKPGTCVLSISLAPGCYRHVQVPDTILLSELAEEILDIFSFDNDHLYAFFMDNKIWSRNDSYYDPRDNSSSRSANRYRLFEFGPEKGMKFKFLFDFGDEWLFQCKVLRLTDEVTENCRVIRSKGEAPSQYSW